jgi:murein DD-endopeptidase MepM/ murein hydrolase activator NlpD
MDKSNMKLIKFTSFVILFSLSACFTQSPAPIEYNNVSQAAKKNDISRNNEQRIKYSNSTATAIPEQEPISSVQIKPKGDLETVTFQEGDSITQLASDFAVSENALLLANRINNKSELRAGRKLIIPKIITHIVKENESLISIAHEFHQDQDALIKLNNIAPPYKVSAGDMLEIIIDPDLRKDTTRIVARNIAPEEKPAPSREVTLITSKSTSYIMPSEGFIKKKFGEAGGIKKEGIIIAAEFRVPVKATADGQVTIVANKPESFGNFIIIKHNDNTLSAYAHLNEAIVTKNQIVRKGEIIGHVGKTGDVSQAELYFALKVNNKPVDPLLYINKE